MTSSPPTATGASAGEGSVPVVDLTATIRGLYEHAEEARSSAYAAEELAARFRRESDYLESLASTLHGSTR